MNRRRFLNFLILGASAPAMLSACRGAESADDGLPELDPEDPLRTAWRRARALEKPLLVIAVPQHVTLRANHERELGYFFNHCDEEALFDLAHVEVVAATAEEVKKVTVELPAFEDRHDGFMPMMWLLPPEAEFPHVAAIGEQLPELYEFGYSSDDDWDTQEAKFKESLEQRNEAIASELREEIWPSEAARAESAASTERPFLVDEARARLRTAPPSGTVWANSTGCGCEIEGETKDGEGMMIACGMAMIPAAASRFLRFYSAS